MRILKNLASAVSEVGQAFKEALNQGAGPLHCQVVLHQHKGITITIKNEGGTEQTIYMDGNELIRIENKIPTTCTVQKIEMDGKSILIHNERPGVSQELLLKDKGQPTTVLQQKLKTGPLFSIVATPKQVTTTFKIGEQTTITQNDKTIFLKCRHFIVDAKDDIKFTARNKKIQMETKKDNFELISGKEFKIESAHNLLMRSKKSFTHEVKKDLHQRVTGNISIKTNRNFSTKFNQNHSIKGGMKASIQATNVQIKSQMKKISTSMFNHSSKLWNVNSSLASLKKMIMAG